MARLVCLIFIFTAPVALNPVAAEYDLDRPLDKPASWRYFQSSHFYAQHRCGEGQLRSITQRIHQFLSAPRVDAEAELGPLLQIRLYASAGDYRRHLRFSKYRDGHYNRRLHLVVTYCDVSKHHLAEQLTLHAIANKPLRKWQRIFVAEIMPAIAKGNLAGAFADVANDRPAALLHVLYSNHWPGRSERATLKLLATHLADRNLLESFVTRLLENPASDDTARELLESLTQDEIDHLGESLAGAAAKNGNKTLRKGQTK